MNNTTWWHKWTLPYLLRVPGSCIYSQHYTWATSGVFTRNFKKSGSKFQVTLEPLALWSVFWFNRGVLTMRREGGCKACNQAVISTTEWDEWAGFHKGSPNLIWISSPGLCLGLCHTGRFCLTMQAVEHLPLEVFICRLNSKPKRKHGCVLLNCWLSALTGTSGCKRLDT